MTEVYQPIQSDSHFHTISVSSTVTMTSCTSFGFPIGFFQPHFPNKSCSYNVYILQCHGRLDRRQKYIKCQRRSDRPFVSAILYCYTQLPPGGRCEN